MIVLTVQNSNANNLQVHMLEPQLAGPEVERLWRTHGRLRN